MLSTRNWAASGAHNASLFSLLIVSPKPFIRVFFLTQTLVSAEYKFQNSVVLCKARIVLYIGKAHIISTRSALRFCSIKHRSAFFPA
jgi:hypothetical protein